MSKDLDKYKNYEKIQIVAVVIENLIGEILLSKRGIGVSHLAGYYENVGGKVDKGESREEAVVREVQEEIGVKVKIQRILFVNKIDYVDVKRRKLYSGTIFKGSVEEKPKIREPNKCEELIWVKKDNLNYLKDNLAPYTKEDFEKLGWL